MFSSTLMVCAFGPASSASGDVSEDGQTDLAVGGLLYTNVPVVLGTCR